MLTQFVKENRDEIIVRCRARARARKVSAHPTPDRVDNGIPDLLSQLEAGGNSDTELAAAASRHGLALLWRGYTVGQVVHDYGDACQTITELAIERKAPISVAEFRTLNRCLDNAIADAVTEYQRQRDLEVVADGIRRSNEDLGFLAHELRNEIGAALLAYEVLSEGTVGIQGSTGALLGRSLIALRDLVDRSLTEVRLIAGVAKPERIDVAEFVEEIEVSASLGAAALGHQLTVTEVAPGLAVDADRLILRSVVSNLLQNAFKYTRPASHVWLHTHATTDRVLFDIEDQCGGLPTGGAAHLFEPVRRRNLARTGLGLGLAVCTRGAAALHGEIRVCDYPGRGCVFTVDLPRVAA